MFGLSARQSLVLFCAIASAILVVISFLTVTGSGADHIVNAIKWADGAIFVGALGLGITQLP